MTGRTKSQAAVNTEAARLTDAMMSRAVIAYRAELEKPRGVRRKGLRQICADFMQLCFDETGEIIKLSHSALNRQVDGGCTRRQAHDERSWITPTEGKIMVDFIVELGSCGWPPSVRRIKEHVDLICRSRNAPAFPEDGVGKHWADRFVMKHSDRIKMADSSPLEDKRGRAVNPENNKEFWELLKDAEAKPGVCPKTTFGSDEVGVPQRSEERERVVTSRDHTGPQYQQRAGTRENTTVIVTICADGTTLPPAVIFKGQAYQVSWGDENPLNASIGYSQKGWTDGEIGAEWIKIFDKQTKHKVKRGEYRLLIVDGHNSHYTVAFLLYAREHLILVLCYPAHTTHIYQGLDVVIFAVLKRFLMEERDKWFRTKAQAMDKNNFLAIYSAAHVRALTPENVKSAFEKTGVWPYNPLVVTEQMLAPSKATSVQAYLPVPMSDPATDALATMFRDLASINDAGRDTEDAHDDQVSGPSDANKQRHAVINTAVEALAQTNLSHLLATTLTTHLDVMPTTLPTTIPRTTSQPLLAIKPQTDVEAILLAALQESQAEAEALRSRNIALRAGNLLNQVYCGNTRSQLQAQDEKKKRKGKGKLTGKPRLLSGDAFYEERVEFEKEKRAETRQKADRKAAMVQYRAAKAVWDKGEVKRKEVKEKETEKHKKAMAVWEKAKAKAAAAAKKQGLSRPPAFRVTKPKMPTLAKGNPRPMVKDFTEGGGSSSSSSGSDSSSEDGEGDENDDEDNE